MKIALIGNDAQQTAWECRPGKMAVQWLSHPSQLTDQSICIDLIGEENPEHLKVLPAFQEKGGLVVANAVLLTGAELPNGFCRINGWPGFLDKERIELVCQQDSARLEIEEAFKQLNRIPEWVNDQVGLIAPRVICSIINEAYLAWGEGVSDKEQIDLAMQLGTNYPLGPFAWANKLGKTRVLQLLEKLSAESNRYNPAALLKEEVYNA